MVKEKSSRLPPKVMNACHGECVITWVPTYITSPPSVRLEVCSWVITGVIDQIN